MSNPDVLDSELHLELYDIIDGWYHDRTRFHLVDVDPDANEMLKSVVALINQRIAEELDYLYEHGHGGGNWRRLIIVRKSRLKTPTKEGGDSE